MIVETFGISIMMKAKLPVNNESTVVCEVPPQRVCKVRNNDQQL